MSFLKSRKRAHQNVYCHQLRRIIKSQRGKTKNKQRLHSTETLILQNKSQTCVGVGVIMTTYDYFLSHVAHCSRRN